MELKNNEEEQAHRGISCFLLSSWKKPVFYTESVLDRDADRNELFLYDFDLLTQ
jgi:hypothetical protein